MRVEIMHLNNGIGNSTTILTGANVIDIVLPNTPFMVLKACKKIRVYGDCNRNTGV